MLLVDSIGHLRWRAQSMVGVSVAARAAAVVPHDPAPITAILSIGGDASGHARAAP